MVVRAAREQGEHEFARETLAPAFVDDPHVQDASGAAGAAGAEAQPAELGAAPVAEHHLGRDAPVRGRRPFRPRRSAEPGEGQPHSSIASHGVLVAFSWRAAPEAETTPAYHYGELVTDR
ncbi:hypothetical protein [Streptomyces sp. NPDC020996]|uniref:hypothetical protein n=1 Tax=Streptomyces sp. NPDC020996 TaxID=3154791 RepID=UPI0033D88B6C